MKQHKKGNMLMMTIILFAVIMIMGTGLLTKAVSSYRISADQVVRQQGYYVTKSALDACKSAIEKKDNNMLMILEKVWAGSGTQRTPWLAFGATDYEYQIDISKKNSNAEEIIIEVRGRTGQTIVDTLQGVVTKSGGNSSGVVLDQVEAIEVTLKAAIDSIDNINPRPEDMLSQGDLTVDVGTGTKVGNIYSKRNVLTHSPLEGDVVAGGTVTLNKWIKGNISARGSVLAHGNVEGDIIGGSDVTISNGIKGDIFAKGNVIVHGEIEGDIIAGGNVTINNNIKGNIYAKGDVVVHGKIQGKDKDDVKGICADGKVTINNPNKVNICSGQGMTLWGKMDGIICGKVIKHSVPIEKLCLELPLPDGTRHHHDWCYGGQGEALFIFEKYQ